MEGRATHQAVGADDMPEPDTNKEVPEIGNTVPHFLSNVVEGEDAALSTQGIAASEGQMPLEANKDKVCVPCLLTCLRGYIGRILAHLKGNSRTAQPCLNGPCVCSNCDAMRCHGGMGPSFCLTTGLGAGCRCRCIFPCR